MNKELKALYELERFVNEDIGIKSHKESGWHLADKPEFHLVKSALELLEEFETLKNYYPPFKTFLKEMFERGHNEDLTNIKEWVEK